MPERSVLHTRLRMSGHVEFVLRGATGTTSLRSLGVVTDGQWHHIVASWGPSSAELYIDGRRQASSQTRAATATQRLTGRNVRFGKPSYDLVRYWDPFTGWLDEIALWDRPLDEAEVASQFRSATGKREN